MRRRDIRNQFLLESATLSVIGGFIGIAIGLVGGFALSTAVALPFGINPLALVLAFGVSAVIGVAFGL